MALALVLLCASRIVITEVMSNPAGAAGAHFPEDRNEYIELYNPGNEAIDLYDWILDDLDGSTDRLIAWQDSSLLAANPTAIINSTWLRPHGYAVVLDSEYTDPNPLGGYEQPYRFGEYCLLLTTRNTTLGNGLATNDPLVIISSSAYGFEDTSTFGTPFDTTDKFPDNPGDGKSWERINLLGPDLPGNWVICPDPLGCTPGRPNSSSSAPDLAVLGLDLVQPESLKPGLPFACRVRIANVGFILATTWSLDVFLDRNGNGLPDRNEECRPTNGWPLYPGKDSTLNFNLTCPTASCDLWARLVCSADRDTADNRLRRTLYPAGTGRFLSLAASCFSPDADGFEDSLEIIYRVPRKGGRLQVTVYDLAGRVAAALLDTRATTEQGTLVWNGTLSSGRPAPRGIYAIRLSYHLPDMDRVEKLPVVLER